MRGRLWTPGIALLLLALNVVHADPSAQLYGELYKRSGMEAQLGQAPALIIRSFRQEAVTRGKGKLPGDVVVEVAREIRKAFSPSVMRAVVTAYLRGHLPEPDARNALRWLDTPAGRKVTRLEEEATTLEAQAAIEEFAANLDKSTMSPEQVALIKQLMVDTQSVELALDIAMNIQKAVAAAALAASAQDDLESLPEVFAQIDRRRDEMTHYFEKTVLISTLYTYQSLSVAELRSYTEFVNTPAGRKYNRTMFEGVRQAATQAALRLGSALGRLGDTLRSRKTL